MPLPITLEGNGLLWRNHEGICCAIRMDPLTSSVLTLDGLRAMVDEVFKTGKDAPLVWGKVSPHEELQRSHHESCCGFG